MLKLAIAAISAALTIATANPALACAGSGYRSVHHTRPAAPAPIKAATRVPAAESKALATTEPALASPTTELTDGNS